MEHDTKFLQASIADDFLSKEEKRSLKELVADQLLNADHINSIRSKVFEIPNQKANSENFPPHQCHSKTSKRTLMLRRQTH